MTDSAINTAGELWPGANTDAWEHDPIAQIVVAHNPDGVPLTTIGAVMGCTRQRTMQVVERALAKMAYAHQILELAPANADWLLRKLRGKQVGEYAREVSRLKALAAKRQYVAAATPGRELRDEEM